MRPEAAIQRRLRTFLEARGWLVEVMHSNAFMSGVPDLYLHHPEYGSRWVDVKVEHQHRYTKAQCQKWPKWESYGVGVWILFDATDAEYAKLFQKPNFRDFWKPSYDKYTATLDSILDTLTMDG